MIHPSLFFNFIMFFFYSFYVTRLRHKLPAALKPAAFLPHHPADSSCSLNWLTMWKCYETAQGDDLTQIICCNRNIRDFSGNFCAIADGNSDIGLWKLFFVNLNITLRVLSYKRESFIEYFSQYCISYTQKGSRIIRLPLFPMIYSGSGSESDFS